MFVWFFLCFHGALDTAASSEQIKQTGLLFIPHK